MPAKFQDPEKTVFVSNVEQRVTEELLWELFLQAGPLINVHIPLDKGSGKNKTFAFITYRSKCSVSYACELFNTLKLFKRSIYCKPKESGGGNNSANVPCESNTGSPNYSTPLRPPNQGRLPPTPSPQFDRSKDYESYNNSHPRNKDEWSRYGGGGGGGEHVRNYDDNRSPNNYRNHSERSPAPYDNNQRQRYGGSYSPAFQQAIGNSMGGGQPSHRNNSYDMPRQNYEHHSPHNSPSHYGPMRSDPSRNHRNNRRQKSQPY